VEKKFAVCVGVIYRDDVWLVAREAEISQHLLTKELLHFHARIEEYRVVHDSSVAVTLLGGGAAGSVCSL
jgi:hypothetical protein